MVKLKCNKVKPKQKKERKKKIENKKDRQKERKKKNCLDKYKLIVATTRQT